MTIPSNNWQNQLYLMFCMKVERVHPIDVVFDVYKETFIKDSKRVIRGPDKGTHFKKTAPAWAQDYTVEEAFCQ